MSSTTEARAGTDLRAPLSSVQEFLCVYDKGDHQGPFGPRHHIVHGWRVRGEVDLDALQGALADLVVRHESLRTVVVRDPDERYQEVHPPSRPELHVREVPDVAPADRARQCDELLVELEASELSATELPHLRAVLARFDERDALLMLLAHHTATDGWSMRILIKDLAARYAARTGHSGHELREPRQYREFATWQYAAADDPARFASQQYWREKLRGGKTLTMPADRPRSAGLSPTTAVYRFDIGSDLIEPVTRMARTMRGSPFMVLLAAFTVVVYRKSGDTDIATPTFTPGRGMDTFEDTVGMFYNFLPVRADISDCVTYRDVLDRTRRACVEGYTHDIPQIPAESPEFMANAMADDEVPIIFQVFPYPFLLDSDKVGDLEYTEVRKRLSSQRLTSDIPDGVLWTLNLDTTGELVGAISYKSALVDEETIAEWVDVFRTELRHLVTSPETVVNPDSRGPYLGVR